jgi:hypothetical protein
MNMDIEVTYVDGKTVTVTARQVDILRLEKYVGKPWVKLSGLADEDSNGTPSLMMDHIWHMAWTASRRADKTGVSEDYDAWCEVVDQVMPVGDDDEAATPLDRTPSPGE